MALSASMRVTNSPLALAIAARPRATHSQALSFFASCMPKRRKIVPARRPEDHEGIASRALRTNLSFGLRWAANSARRLAGDFERRLLAGSLFAGSSAKSAGKTGRLRQRLAVSARSG